MKHKFPILPALVLGLTVGLASLPTVWPMVSAHAGASAVEAPPKVATEVETSSLLRDAAATLAAQESVSAKLRMRVDLFGQQLTGSGRYLQGASSSRQFRYELKLQMGDSFSSVQQVCDGKSLWIRRQIEGPPTIAKVDLTKVEAAVDASNQAIAASSIPPRGGLSMISPTVGGLAQVLSGLDRAFDFRPAGETTIGAVPMRVVVGTWNQPHLMRLLPDQKAALEAGGQADLSKLQLHMPDHVVVHLGRDDLFPYRIEYRRTKDGKLPTDALDASAAKTIVSMQLFEARFGSGVDTQEFIYTPGSAAVADETAAYLSELGIQQPAAAPH